MPIAVSIVITLLVVVGLFFLFDIKLSAFSVFFKSFERAEATKRQIDRITGKKPGMFRKRIIKAEQMLMAADMGDDLDKYKIQGGLFAVAGIAIGFAIDNIFVAMVLAPSLAMLPFLLIHARTSAFIRQTNDGMQAAMIVITNSYVQCEDFVAAVRMQQHNLVQPMRSIFSKFLFEVDHVNPSVITAIKSMYNKIDNRYWHMWCDMLIQCQGDRGLRHALKGLLKRQSTTIKAQMKLDTVIKSLLMSFIIEIFIVILIPIFIGFVYPDYSHILFETLAGKLTLAIGMLMIVFCILRILKINQPIELK